jgi:excisionase family DNA binding protein
MSPHEFGLSKAAYTVNETLQLLSVGRTNLYRLVKDGRLVPTKIGKKTLFAAPDIVSLLSKHRGAG